MSDRKDSNPRSPSRRQSRSRSRSPPRRSRSPPRRSRSPPRRSRSPPRRSRSRSRSPARRSRSPPRRRRDSRSRGRPPPRRNTPSQGKFKITVEGIPDDMNWMELKDLGRQSGSSMTFARTYRSGNLSCGMIEFSRREDADNAVRDLDDRRMSGCKERLRCFHGDAATRGDQGKYKGHGKYEGGRGRSNSGRRSPSRRRSRSRSRRSVQRNGRGGGEEIMTVLIRDLPDDSKESEVKEDLEKCGTVLRVVMMRRDGKSSAFIRMETVKDAEKAVEELRDGHKVCGGKVSAELARRNTELDR